jgi:acetylornithine deacetylase/succinyl-diaminopimelate desuccinylase-like protein
MIEGEEEVGSNSLSWFVERNQEKLSNDVILISDTGMIANLKLRLVVHVMNEQNKTLK